MTALSVHPDFNANMFHASRILSEMRAETEPLIFNIQPTLKAPFQKRSSLSESWMQQGEQYFEKHKLEEAIQCFTRALQINPRILPRYNRLARALLENGEGARAKQILDQTLKADQSCETYELFTLSQMVTGDHQTAAAVARAGLKRFPSSYMLFQLLADSGKMTESDPALAVAILRAHDERIPPRERVVYYLAIARFFDSIGNHQSATYYMAHGNALNFAMLAPSVDIMNMRLNSAPNAMERYFDHFNPHLHRFESMSSIDVTPIFIVGAPRSGTSLVEQILASHSAIYGGGELTHIHHLCQRMTEALPDRKFPDILSYFNREQLKIMAESYLARVQMLARRKNVRYVTDKLPGNFLYLGVIRMLFPNAKIIHCSRDAKDTALSILMRDLGDGHAYSYHPETTAHYYHRYKRLIALWDERIPGFVHHVKYETLVGDMESVTRNMLAHIDLPWDANCLQFHKTKRTNMTASTTQISRPIYDSSIGKWESYANYLSPIVGKLEQYEKIAA